MRKWRQSKSAALSKRSQSGNLRKRSVVISTRVVGVTGVTVGVQRYVQIAEMFTAAA